MVKNHVHVTLEDISNLNYNEDPIGFHLVATRINNCSFCRKVFDDFFEEGKKEFDLLVSVLK